MARPTYDVAKVAVYVDPYTLLVGQIGQASAIALDEAGRRVKDVSVELSTDDPTLLLLGKRNGAGKRQIQALAPGKTTVYGSTTNLDGQEVTGASELVTIEHTVPITPTPVVDAMPSALVFRVYKGSTLPIESQEVALHSGTSEPLDISGVFVTEESPWLEVRDQTDNQVASYEVVMLREILDTMELGSHQTLISFRYVHPTTGATARTDVPVLVELLAIVVPEPDPEPEPEPPPIDLPPVGKLHPALMAPLVSREAMLDVFGETANVILTKMKGALDRRWAAELDSWGGDYYSRTRARAAYAYACSDQQEMAKAKMQGEGYLSGYLYGTADGAFQHPSPHWFQPDSVWFLYKAFGDQKALYAMQRVARGFMELETNHVRWGQAVYQTDQRIQSRFMASELQVATIDDWGSVGQPTYLPWGTDANGWSVPDGTPANCLQWEIERNLGWQHDPTGDLLGTEPYGGGQYNWMVALLCQRFAQVYDVFSQDPRIVSWVENRLQYIWETQQIVDPTWGWSFNYANKQGPDGGPYPAPDLTGLYLDSFGWLAARSGNPDHADRFRFLLDNYAGNVNVDGSKQTNQGFREALTGMSYMIGMAD